jgi:glycosyltransferase involved in cell wall biosynthesis
LPRAGQFYAAHPELGGRPYILFLSRLHPGKGLHYLAEAAARLVQEGLDFRLVVAGPDYGARSRFEELVERLNIADRVHVVGPLYGSEKMSALVDATCLCLPSEHETFSMAITEALACRLPVVISGHCHFAEVAEVGAGLIVRLDPADVSRALGTLLTDAAARERMGEAGQRLVMERFTWPHVAERAIAAYTSATARRTAKSG